MSSAGTILDMVNRSRQNRQELKNRQQRRRQMREMYISKVSGYKSAQHLEEVSPEEISRIKREIRENMRQDLRQKRVVSIIVLCAVVVFACMVVWFMLFLVSGRYRAGY